MAQPGDTVSSLAQLIHLDISEAGKWLKGWHGEAITSCARYQVPNTVAVYTSKPSWGDGDITYVAHLRERALDYGQAYANKGYYRIQWVNQDDSDEFINMWNADGIYAIMFGGHGNRMAFEAMPSAPGSQVDPTQVNPPYKLQAVVALCCFGSTQNVNGRTWEHFISDYGSFIGFSWYANWFNGWWVEDDINIGSIPP